MSQRTRPNRSDRRARRVDRPQTAPKPNQGEPSTATAPRPSTAATEPVALVVSFEFDSGPAEGPPLDVSVRLTGHRIGATPRMQRDAFTRTETVVGVVPGSGHVAATAWIHDLNPGEWDVTAELAGPERLKRSIADLRLQLATWSWRRWSLEPVPPQPISTRWAPLAPLARTPAVIPGSFTALALVALVVAFAVQPGFLRLLRLDAASGVTSSLVGLVVGLVAAKAWYMVLKGPSRRTLMEGWSVDGFLIAAPLAAVATAAVQGLPPGAYLDATTPGIFLAVAIGRLGCFFTGCCAGRMTSGRGIVSSDRRVVARRVPAQLYESAIGLVLAVVTALLVLTGLAAGQGFVFLAAILGYIGARQWLLRQRAERRTFSWARATPTAAKR